MSVGPPECAVTVAVITYRRPEGLRRLLEGLAAQKRTPARPFRLTVLVVDNDAGASARPVIDPFRENAPFELVYVVEPRQGIPCARNRALDAAPSETDLFCFIDDDEWPAEDWLDAQLAVIDKTGAQCVYGPLEPVYPPEGPRFFVESRIFEVRPRPDCSAIGFAASNNVMMDYRYLRAERLRFDERMRFTGGSDFAFFNQAVRGGMRIAWAARAIVYEHVPPARMTWKWLIQRQYRLGNTYAVRDTLYGTTGEKLGRLTYGCARIGLGALMLPALAVSPRWGMRALTHVLRGAGMVVGILGHAYEEYAPARLESSKG